ncbi:hypothetical protein ES705_04672 [subsurface metagenome]
MTLIKSKSRTSILSLIILSLFAIGILSTSIVASSTYQHTLAKGTEIFEITKYDNDGWENTVGNTTMPDDWFEGDSNKTGAQGKYTVKGWNYINLKTYDIILQVLFSIEQFMAFMTLSELGYNETEINNNYTNSYWLWYGLGAEWDFTDSEFNETADDSNSKIIILYHPEDYKKILDDYNDLVDTIINDPGVILPIKSQFSNITADELLWKLIFEGLAIAEPHGNYLESLITELGCENASVSGSTLIIKRYGLTNYTVEILYGDKGIMSSFTVKDISNTVIYQITSSNSEWLFYLILILASTCSVVLVAYLVIRNRRHKR